MKISHFIIIFLALGCSIEQNMEPVIQKITTPTNSLLQAISIVDEQTIWISGHDATVIRSRDGGSNWDLIQYWNDTLQFRDVHAFNSDKAILMSAGLGSLSRIFTFSNDSIWIENFVMRDSLGFLNSIAFWDDYNGIAFGDQIDDYPYILLTTNGGLSWNRASTDNMPMAGKGEGGFAASGTCVTTGKDGKAWIATGAGGNCRVLLTNDYGLSWVETKSPLIKGESAGNTSISFIGETGFLTGGDISKTDIYTDNCAFSFDAGQSWALTNRPNTKGAFYGGAITHVDEKIFAFACGPKGLDFTSDLGKSWTTLDTLDYWAVSFSENIGFVSGRNGEVLKISLQK